MGLQEIFDKYGKPSVNKEWFTLDEALIRIPFELRDYLDLNDEGKLVEIKPAPEDLQPLVERFKENWDKFHDPSNLIKY